MIRNGYLPEREVVTAIGPVTVKVPKVRDRSGSGVKFNSNIVPPYIRKSPRVSAALPWLYLRGVSTGDMGEALSVLLGEEAKGLSPNVVSRVKVQWSESTPCGISVICQTRAGSIGGPMASTRGCAATIRTASACRSSSA